MTFIEFAVDTFIKEAEKFGYKPAMLQAFKTESNSQLESRISSVIDSLGVAYAYNYKACFCVNNEDVKEIVAQLKERLASQLAAVP